MVVGNVNKMNQVVIRYSKRKTLFTVLTFSALIAVGIYLVQQDKLWFGVLVMCVGLFFIRGSLKEFLNNRAQLIIDNNGLTISYIDLGLITWEKIEKIEIKEEGSKYTIQWLILTFYKPISNLDEVEIPIDGFNISIDDLGERLKEFCTNERAEIIPHNVSNMENDN